MRFWDGTTHQAEVVGTDPSTDLAVFKVDAPDSLLVPLALGDSSALDVGDAVAAIGSPFGLEGTLTTGVVSALHRQMTAPNKFTITDSVQTDAAINHGNSGGPLLDTRGRVVGVNAQIESDSGGNDGIGFAIPSDTVRSIVSQLVDTGTVEHAYLGVGLVAVENGVVVTEVREERRSGTGRARRVDGHDDRRRRRGADRRRRRRRGGRRSRHQLGGAPERHRREPARRHGDAHGRSRRRAAHGRGHARDAPVVEPSSPRLRGRWAAAT